MGILDNKVAIISGASSGIGKAAAHLFAAEGASLILNARGREGLERAAAEIRAKGGKAVAISGDVGLADTHAELVEEAVNRSAASTSPSTMPAWSARSGRSPTSPSRSGIRC